MSSKNIGPPSKVLQQLRFDSGLVLYHPLPGGKNISCTLPPTCTPPHSYRNLASECFPLNSVILKKKKNVQGLLPWSFVPPLGGVSGARLLQPPDPNSYLEMKF